LKKWLLLASFHFRPGVLIIILQRVK
jgi:hypothetical protein